MWGNIQSAVAFQPYRSNLFGELKQDQMSLLCVAISIGTSPKLTFRIIIVLSRILAAIIWLKQTRMILF